MNPDMSRVTSDDKLMSKYWFLVQTTRQCTSLICSTSLPSRNQVDSSLLVVHNTEAVAASPEPTWPAPIGTLDPRKDKTEGNNEITMPVPNVKVFDGYMRLHSDLTMLKMVSKSEV